MTPNRGGVKLPQTTRGSSCNAVREHRKSQAQVLIPKVTLTKTSLQMEDNGNDLPVIKDIVATSSEVRDFETPTGPHTQHRKIAMFSKYVFLRRELDQEKGVY